MRDYTRMTQSRHWLVAQAEIDMFTSALTDGILMWGQDFLLTPLVNRNLVAAFVPPQITPSSAPVALVRIDELYCRVFYSESVGSADLLVELDPFTASTTQTGAGVVTAGGGSTTLPVAPAFGGLVPVGGPEVATGNNIVGSVTGVPPLNIVTTAAPTGATPLHTYTTPKSSYALGFVGGTVIGSAFTSTSTGFTADTVFPGITGTLSIQPTEPNALGLSASLYVSQFNLDTVTWNLKDPLNVSADTPFDYLDLKNDVFYSPCGFTPLTSRAWTLRLPEPVLLGPG